MATTMYRWKKYTIKETTTYTEAGWTYYQGPFPSGWNSVSGYSTYSFDATNGVFTVSNYVTRTASEISTQGFTVYTVSSDGKSISRAGYSDNTTTGNPALQYSVYSNYVNEEVTRGQGDYIEEVRSTDVNAYPMNGEKDGYWYYYNMYIIIPDIKAYVNIGGVAKEVGAIYVNVDGVVKKVSDLYCNIGGVAKKYNQ